MVVVMIMLVIVIVTTTARIPRAFLVWNALRMRVWPTVTIYGSTNLNPKIHSCIQKEFTDIVVIIVF